MAELDTYANPEITQFYDITLVGVEGLYSIRLTTLPDQRPAAGLYEPASLHEIAELLDLDLLFELPSNDPQTYLPHAIVSVLADGDPFETFQLLYKSEHPSRAIEQIGISPELLTFAEYCAFQPLVPIEESPLRKAVLAALITASGGVAAIAATAAGPIVLAYFGGSILVGGASTIAVKVADKWVDRRFGGN